MNDDNISARKKVLTSPENIVISRDLAVRLFASVDVLGKSIETTFGEKIITGVLVPVTKNSHDARPPGKSRRNVPRRF